MSFKIIAFALLIALIVVLFMRYLNIPRGGVIITIPTATTSSITTTTLTKTVTSRFTITKTVWRTVTLSTTSSKQKDNSRTTATPTKKYALCTFNGYSGTSKVKFEVLKVVRGEDANDAVKNTNMFNKKAPEGYEYILVDVRITLLDGKRFSVNPLLDFKMETNGRLVTPKLIVYPENMPQLESSELLPSGSTSGWLAFIIPAGAPARLHLEPLMEESSMGCLVSLGP